MGEYEGRKEGRKTEEERRVYVVQKIEIEPKEMKEMVQ